MEPYTKKDNGSSEPGKGMKVGRLMLLRKKNPSQQPTNQHNIEAEQVQIEVQMDKIISKIDSENTVRYKKLLVHTHPLRTSPSSQGSSNETESNSLDLNPDHWETATTISDGVVVLTSNISDDESSVEVMDLSFDQDTAKQFIDYDKKKLAQVHSNMNVRRCKSKLCGVCQKTKGVCFIKARSKKKAMF